jgi:LmbE family N-acetylglucosaminyl deacetylase
MAKPKTSKKKATKKGRTANMAVRKRKSKPIERLGNKEMLSEAYSRAILNASRRGRPYAFIPVKRNTTPAPVPHVFKAEEGLPRNHKVVVFLPHSDDGRYIGGSIYAMNKKGENGKPRNNVKVAIVSPGHSGVMNDAPKEEKAGLRWDEAICWGESLGLRPKQMIAVRADKTYEDKRGIKKEDQAKIDALIRKEKPTIVMVPHISDTAQHINFNSRRMVMKSVNKWLEDLHREGNKARRGKEVIVMEYPTNHVPILPPSDKNLILKLDEAESIVKHTANKAHESQKHTNYELAERMVEAIDATLEADELANVRKSGRRFSRFLSGIDYDAMHTRGEHLGVTRIRVKGKGNTPKIVEERVKFPLSAEDRKRWGTN